MNCKERAKNVCMCVCTPASLILKVFTSDELARGIYFCLESCHLYCHPSQSLAVHRSLPSNYFYRSSTLSHLPLSSSIHPHSAGSPVKLHSSFLTPSTSHHLFSNLFFTHSFHVHPFTFMLQITPVIHTRNHTRPAALILLFYNFFPFMSVYLHSAILAPSCTPCDLYPANLILPFIHLLCKSQL